MCGITKPVMLRNELRTACPREVKRLLFDLIGAEALNSATEEQLLRQIKLVAVRGLHKEVYRQKFHAMRQGEGESITHFLARLRSLAKFCDYTITCPNEQGGGRKINYSSDMVAGQMVAGLANMEHQCKILSEATTLTTLEEKFNRLVSLETTDKSTPHLYSDIHPATISNIQKSDHGRRAPQETKPCGYCGENLHPDGSRSRWSCRAAKIKCNNCGITGHVMKACRRARWESTNRSSVDTVESSILTSRVHNKGSSRIAYPVKRSKRGRGKVSPTQPKAVPHLIWNGSKFQRGSPDPPPTLTLEVTLVPEAHAEFGYTAMEANSLHTHRITAIADTGAQTCSSGPKIQRILKCPDKRLIQTSHRIRGITDNPLDIKGVIFAKIRAGLRETHQMICVRERLWILSIRVSPKRPGPNT